MRGNPIKEWIIFSALWLLLLIPVIKLTGSRKPAQTQTEPQAKFESAQSVNTTALMRYTGNPLYLKITQNNKILCDIKKPPSNETEQEILLIIDENGAELLLQAGWPDDRQQAFEIELIVDGEEEQRVHCWAEEELDEVVSFSWQ